MQISDNFKKYITEKGREISLKISFDNNVIEKAGVKSCTKSLKGSLYKSVMQTIDLELEGNLDIKDKEIKVDFGVSYNGSPNEYVHWGTFMVDKETIEYSVEKNSTSFTAYDLLFKSHVTYDLEMSYPITVKE